MLSRLKIKEPCNQDWNKMTILDRSKFCQKCKKEVIDFTGWNREEILRVLNSSEKVCGRVDQSQLKENYLHEYSSTTSISKLAIFVSLSSLLGLSEPINAKPKEHHTEQTEIDKWKSIFPEKETDSITIEGIVLDSDGLELPGVNIIFNQTKIATQSDFDGKFSITIPSEELKEKNFLVFSYIGFETRQYRFYKKNRYLNIRMVEDTTVMGEVIIVHRDNIFRKTGRFFSALFSKKRTEAKCE